MSEIKCFTTPAYAARGMPARTRRAPRFVARRMFVLATAGAPPLARAEVPVVDAVTSGEEAPVRNVLLDRGACPTARVAVGPCITLGGGGIAVSLRF